jgi:hypothetical protein
MPLEFYGLDTEETKECDLAHYVLELAALARRSEVKGAKPEAVAEAEKAAAAAEAELAAYKAGPDPLTFSVGHILEARWVELDAMRRAWIALPEGEAREEALRRWNREIVRYGIRGHRNLFTKAKGGGRGASVAFKSATEEVTQDGAKVKRSVVSDSTLEGYYRSGLMPLLAGVVFRAQGLGEDLPNG